MRLDSLVKVVEKLDFSALREVALRCLRARGFEPALSDGPNDGGFDFLVYLSGTTTAPYAVQVSVEKRWHSKLREDVLKVKRQGTLVLLFISSQRIPNTDFITKADALLRETGIRVEKMDAQDIAGLALAHGFIADVLESAGIHVQAPNPKSFARTDLRRDVAYACAFFEEDARTLRQVAIDEAVLTAVAEAGGKEKREVVVGRVALSLRLAANQRSLVSSAMDRMLQEGRLQGKNGSIALESRALLSRQAVLALQQENADALRQAVCGCLEPFVKKAVRLEQAVGAVLEDLGALLMDTAARTSADLGMTPSQTVDGVRARLQHLETTLEAIGLSGEDRRRAVTDLARVTSQSTLGNHLLAGEMVLHLFHLGTPHLLRALEGRDSLTVVLDTPVAMPLLCNLLYEPADQQLFIASAHVYDQLTAHGIPMVIPAQYLEEIASHLIFAYRDYQDIIEMDPDLRASENAFVAHYVALRERDPSSVGSFIDYLSGFEVNEALMRGDFFVARDAVLGRLTATFGRYRVQRLDLPRPPSAAHRTPSSLRRAEEAIARVQRDGEFKARPMLLTEHDAATLGWLFEREQEPHPAYILCTWDRLHFEVRRQQGALGWEVLNPIALGDVLCLAAAGQDELRMASPWVLALQFSDADAARGATIWDTIVRIERGRLHDAALRAEASAFKQDWLRRTAEDPRARDLQTAWECWKSEHLSQR